MNINPDSKKHPSALEADEGFLYLKIGIWIAACVALGVLLTIVGLSTEILAWYQGLPAFAVAGILIWGLHRREKWRCRTSVWR